jgi:hypothetical protein
LQEKLERKHKRDFVKDNRQKIAEHKFTATIEVDSEHQQSESTSTMSKFLKAKQDNSQKQMRQEQLKTKREHDE